MPKRCEVGSGTGPLKRVCLSPLMATLLGWCGVAGAQGVGGLGGVADVTVAEPPASFGVFVRDSAVAVEKLQLAQRMQNLAEWKTSAEVYQEILDQYSDRLIASATDAAGRTIRYASVTSLVQERLARWPDAGRLAYNAMYDAAARQMLDAIERPLDRRRLSAVLGRYFITDAGRDAGLGLVELQFEAAEFSSAASLGQRLLDLHPNLGDARPLLMARTLAAWLLAGETGRAEKLAESIHRHAADAVVTLGGEPRRLGEWATQQLRDAPRLDLGRSAGASSWPVAFGSVDRGRVGTDPAGLDPRQPRNLAKLFSVELIDRKPRMPNEGPRAFGDPAMGGMDGMGDPLAVSRRQTELGTRSGIFPVADGGEMFLTDNANVYAVSLATGLPLPGWAASYPRSNGVFTLPDAVSSPALAQQAVALTDSHVIAVMGQRPRAISPFNVSSLPPGGTPQVVALDRRTGKVAWSCRPQELSDLDPTLGFTEFVGSPVVAGDSVYLVARGGRQQQFDESFVVCLALADGSPRWARHLVSGNQGGAMDYVFTEPRPATHLAYSDGRLFVSTDMGGIAAVDAADGSLAWLSVYPRPQQEAVRRWQFDPTADAEIDPAFAGNPVIVRSGKVISIPADAGDLFVHDAVSGEMLLSVPLSRFGDARVLAGIAGDRLVLAGDRVISVLSLAALLQGPAAAEVVLQQRQLWRETHRDTRTIRGRPFLTESSIYVPTSFALVRLSLSDLSVLDTYPPRGEWADIEQGPGNALVIEDGVILAGPDRVDVYTDPVVLRRRLDEQIAAEPASPLPRLRYAQTMFAAGQIDEAMQRMDEAVTLAGDDAAMQGQIYSKAIEFASGLLRRRDGAVETQVVEQVLRRAELTARSPLQQVQVRLAGVRLARVQKDAARQLDFLQQILASQQLADVRVRSAAQGEMSAGRLAREQINALLQTHGRQLYASQEQTASRMLDEARAVGDPAGMLRIARQFPNSRAALAALQQSAESFEARGQTAQARAVWRELLVQSHDPSQRAGVAGQLLRSYLRADQFQPAMGVLRTLVRIAPQELVQPIPDHPHLRSARTAAELLGRLEELHVRSQSADPPDMRLRPATADSAGVWDEAGSITIEGVTRLVRTSVGHDRPDRVVAIGAVNELVVVPVAAAEPMLRLRVEGLGQRSLAAWKGDVLLLAHGDRITAVDTRQQKVLWQTSLEVLPQVTADADPVLSVEGLTDEDTTGVSGLDADGGERLEPPIRIGVARRRAIRQIPMLAGADNEQDVGWVADLKSPDGVTENVTQLVPIDGRVLLGTSRGRVAAVDFVSGRLLWQTRPGDRSFATFQTLDEVTAVVTTDESSSRVVVLDNSSGQSIAMHSFGGSVSDRILNTAIGRDGTLLLSFNNRLLAFELLSDPRTLAWESRLTSAVGGTPVREVDPSHLQVVGGRAVVLVDSRTDAQSVHVLDLLTGEPITVKDGAESTPLRLPARAESTAVTLHTAGSRLYVAGQRSLVSYDVLDPAQHEWYREPPAANLSVASVLAGTRELVTVDWSDTRIDQTSNFAVLNVYSRDITPSGTESGLWLGELILQTPGPHLRDEWKAVEGGLYYARTDGKLVFVRGANK